MLNLLYEDERMLRDITKQEDENGRIVYSGPDLFNNDYDIAVGFLFAMFFKGLVTFELGHAWNPDDVEDCIINSEDRFKNHYLKIWKKYKDKYPYFSQLTGLLSGKFSSLAVVDADNEKLVSKWLNNKYLFTKNNFAVDDYYNDIVAMEVISRCKKQLGLHNKSFQDIFVDVKSYALVKNLLLERPESYNIVFNNCDDTLNDIIAINNAISHHANILTSANLLLHNHFDGIIIQKDKEKVTLQDSNLLGRLEEGGFAIIFGYDRESHIEEEFLNYEIPLMFDNYNSTTLVVRKIKDKTSMVRYGSFYVNGVSEISYLTSKLTECIKNDIATSFYQVLQKEDFKYNRSLKFDDVKRPEDQLDFIWRKKTDVFSICEEVEERIVNVKVDENKIINAKNLSKDPFTVSAGNKYKLINYPKNRSQASHVLDECEIKRVDDFNYSYQISDNYYSKFLHLYDLDCKIESDEDIELDQSICCRLLNEPCLLYNATAGLLRVNASRFEPVCFRKYSFFFDEDTYRIGCFADCDVIKINPEYDENFIIYQLLNQKDPLNTTHILVAPTIEEQHTYFLNKRLDYVSSIKPVIDEIETEVENSIAESPTSITGVGFSNFRRFTNLPIMPLSGVNIFVGSNNAGKSTLVKGMLLTLDNLKNLVVDNTADNAIAPKFHFDANGMHDVHVGTFNRSYSYSAEVDPEDPNRRCMSFSLSCAHFEITLTLIPTDDGDASVVAISKIGVVDKKRNASFEFDYESFTSSARFFIGSEEIDYHYSGFKVKNNKVGELLIPLLIKSIIPSENNQPGFLEDKAQLDKIKGKSGFILEIADELERVIQNVKVEYIYAHGVTQKVLFNYNDKNDFMAQTLHDLYAEKIGDAEKRFICEWLETFGVGKDYDVHTIGGEAYIIQIMKDNGRMTYLADMGMGANQIVILILRLAIIIHRQRMFGDTLYKPTIIIEEPEQNMHPAFQSKLATLFHKVNKDYGFNFIVETHSEYLVRKSQVLVSEQGYEDKNEMMEKNPFKVYYFPTEGKPYEMLYRTDGNFSNEFGIGFFDVANNLLFEIL